MIRIKPKMVLPMTGMPMLAAMVYPIFGDFFSHEVSDSLNEVQRFVSFFCVRGLGWVSGLPRVLGRLCLILVGDVRAVPRLTRRGTLN